MKSEIHPNNPQLLSLDDIAQQRGYLQNLQDLIQQALNEGWSYSTLLNEIKRDQEKLDVEITYHNNKARDMIVRRELGLPKDARVSGSQIGSVFNIFDPFNTPQS